jgi:hypothetical protein
MVPTLPKDDDRQPEGKQAAYQHVSDFPAMTGNRHSRPVCTITARIETRISLSSDSEGV